MTAEETAALPYRPGVGVMLVNPAGLVFAGQRIDSAESAWQMPQGGIDSGEPPETAALRELCEETGVTPDLVEVVARTDDWLRYDLPAELMGRLWGGRYRGQAQLWFLMRFLGSEAQIRIDTEHPEFSAWAWLVPDELPARIVPFKRDVYARVLAEFTPYLQSAPE